MSFQAKIIIMSMYVVLETFSKQFTNLNHQSYTVTKHYLVYIVLIWLLCHF